MRKGLRMALGIDIIWIHYIHVQYRRLIKTKQKALLCNDDNVWAGDPTGPSLEHFIVSPILFIQSFSLLTVL